MTNFIKSTSIYLSDKNDCPEKRLFIAILSQAVHDAFSAHVPRFEKQAARNFLTSNSKDFQNICELAGRNSNYVKEKIQKKVLRDNGWNVDVKVRITSPRRRTNKKHLTGNAYYAAKKANEAAALHQGTS
jgi:hypothetical protein